jgi:hypothetical protein
MEIWVSELIDLVMHLWNSKEGLGSQKKGNVALLILTILIFSLAQSKFTFNDIFVNIPINIRTSFGYTNALLSQLEASEDVANQYEHFDLGTTDFLNKNLEVCLVCETVPLSLINNLGINFLCR